MSDPLADAVRMVDGWERDADEKAARFQTMAARVEQITITESVADGAVSVTVGHNGIPTDVAMTDGVRQMAPHDIAANVMAAMRKAQSRYPARLAEIVIETVGEDDPAARHIVAAAERNFPAPPPEDEAPPAAEHLRFADSDEDELAPAPPPRPARSHGNGPDDGDDFGDDTIYGR